MIEVSLNSLQAYFKEENMEVELKSSTEEIPIDRLILNLGVDEQNRPQQLEVVVIEKKLPESKAVFIHMSHILPFKVQDDALGEVARYLLFINKSLEYPGFGLSEVDRMIYYRHELQCTFHQVSQELLGGILGYIMLITDSYSSRIEKIATQEKTFYQTVSEDLKLNV